MAVGRPTTVRVLLWGREVGRLVDTAGTITFQYAPDFVRNGFSISPISLPLQPRAFRSPPTRDVFQGLYGVFADSLPDLYGKKIVSAYFRQKYGDATYRVSPLQTLMYIGSRGLGALEYAPVEVKSPLSREALQLSEMVAFARNVIQGNVEVHDNAHAVITSIMQSGSLAGGARPKAVIGWQEQTNTIIAGVPPLPPGFEHWIIKFDGTQGIPEDWGKIEYTYSQLARLCGIEMSDTRLMYERNHAHFMTKRFDIDSQGKRLHMHSLSGLLQNDFNDQRSLDYGDFHAAVRQVTRDEREVRKAFTRMVFNYIGRNCDDHTKNFSFLMDPSGSWRLSPQYDLCFSYGTDAGSWVHHHQMTVNGVEDFGDADLIKLGKQFDVKEPSHILAEIRQVFADHWPRLAAENGIDPANIHVIGSSQRLLGHDRKLSFGPSERSPEP